MRTNKKAICCLEAAGNDFGPAGPRYDRDSSDPRVNLINTLTTGSPAFVICGASIWSARRGIGPIHTPGNVLIAHDCMRFILECSPSE